MKLTNDASLYEPLDGFDGFFIEQNNNDASFFTANIIDDETNINFEKNTYPDILPAYAYNNDGTTDPEYFFSGEDRGLTPVGGKPSFTLDQAANQITRSGTEWANPTNVTYAYRATASQTILDDIEIGGFAQFSSIQIAQTELTLQSWSDLANITFTRVGTGTSGVTAFSDNATMLFGSYSTGASGAAAFAYFPGNTGNAAYSGDSWYNVSQSANSSPALLNYGRQTLAHEVGHAIGLSHPGAYNAGEGVSITYANDAEYYEDSRQYTVMSYFGSFNTGASLSGFSGAPLLDDIAAVQSIYGVNLNTRTGDTVYGFNSNTGRDFYEGIDASTILIFSVWDAGGYDTLDFSGYSVDQRIDLTEGNFSNVGGQIGNISIAEGALIEKAIGGTGDDTLISGDATVTRSIAPTYNGVPATGTPFQKLSTDTNDTFATAISIDGAYNLALNNNIETSTGLPHTTITAQGSGDFDYYVFTIAGAGQIISFDIDQTTNLDAYLYLYDSAGTQLAKNDDSALDAGSSITQDSFLQHTFSTAGTYYLLVNEWTNPANNGGSDFGDGPDVGSSYTLHVSLADSNNIVLDNYNAYELFGGSGDDQLISGTGSDTLTGSTGADTFVLEENTGVDTITDFEIGIDTIDLTAFGGKLLAINASGRGVVEVDLQTSLIFVQDGANALLAVQQFGKAPVYDVADALIIFENTLAQNLTFDDFLI